MHEIEEDSCTGRWHFLAFIDLYHCLFKIHFAPVPAATASTEYAYLVIHMMLLNIRFILQQSN